MKLTTCLKSIYAALALFILQIQTSFAKLIPSNDFESSSPENSSSFSEGNFSFHTKILYLIFLILSTLVELPIYYFLGFKSKKTIWSMLWMLLIKTIGLITFMMVISYMNQNRSLWNGGWKALIYIIPVPLIIAIISGIFFKLFIKEVSWKRAISVALLANVVSIAFSIFVITSIPELFSL